MVRHRMADETAVRPRSRVSAYVALTKP
ncbi:MAG: hypothetical protein V7605_2430, partial [Acidimicrobiaceae bacterium]